MLQKTLRSLPVPSITFTKMYQCQSSRMTRPAFNIQRLSVFSATAGVFHERGVGGGEWLGLLDALVPRPPPHEEHQDAGHHSRRLERHSLRHRAAPVETLRRCRFVTAVLWQSGAVRFSTAVLGRFSGFMGCLSQLCSGDFLGSMGLPIRHYCSLSSTWNFCKLNYRVVV